MPFYVVRQGRKPGVYNTWDECKGLVSGFSGAEYKKFDNYSDAQDYLHGRIPIQRTISKNSTKSKSSISINTSTDLLQETIRTYSASASVVSSRQNSNSNGIQHEIYKVAYSDGCCYGNGQFGSQAGYGVYWDDDHPWNVSERLQGDQTNQRAELQAAIAAMETALGNHVTHLEIRTDSRYTINSATNWIKNWKKMNWIKKTDSQPVMNQDLMKKIDELQDQLQVKWTYVAGHSSDRGNDAADRLAKAGARRK